MKMIEYTSIINKNNAYVYSRIVDVIKEAKVIWFFKKQITKINPLNEWKRVAWTDQLIVDYHERGIFEKSPWLKEIPKNSTNDPCNVLNA